ncbi:unnamed protein product [Symbiodinium sp. CCMP2592]|nr:unnamed protein product [Symbiodinium sp. CCMP2592]
MNWRKEQIRSSASGHFVFLSSDSSPQSGTDFLLTLEDRIERQYAGLVVDATDDEIASWNLSDYLKTSSLPVAVVGAGNSGVAGKYEGLLHSIMCDLGNEAHAELIQRYTRDIVGYCSDYGAEWHFAQVPALDLDDLREAGVSNSGGLLKKQDVRPDGLLSEFTADGDMAAAQLPAEILGVQAPPIANEPASSASISLLGSMKMPGIKHMFDNISNYVLGRLAWYPTFAEYLRTMTRLLHEKEYRQRLVDTCFSSGPAAQFKRVMSYYDGGSFITWRWSSVVTVVRALLKRRGALMAGFDSLKFGGGPDLVSDGLGDAERRSKFVIEARFERWSHNLRIVKAVNVTATWDRAAGDRGSTAEDIQEMTKCKLRGRRSPEFACGAFEEFCLELQEIASSNLLVVCTPLDEQQRSILVKDWHTATDAILSELRLKTGHWDCIELYETSSASGHAHPITARFLNPGQHRNVAQQMSRAPNSSEPLISTEARLHAFQDIFNSPEALKSATSAYEHLTDKSYLAVEIAHLVGGPNCVPTRTLSHKELVELLYHRTHRFKRGKTAAKVIPNSDIAAQQASKAALTEGKGVNSLGDMMSKHFRDVMDDTGFYSLPAFLLKRVPIQSLQDALTTSPAIGRATGVLPICSAEQNLPLADREQRSHSLADETSAALPAWLQVDPEAETDIAPAQHLQSRASSSSSVRKDSVLQNLQDTPDDSLVIFRVANKRPHLRKRPLASVDGILPHDMTIRIYDVMSMTAEEQDTSISAAPSKHQDLPLVHLFDKMRDDVCQDVLLHMQQWQMRDALPLRFASHVSGLCSSAENLLRDCLEAKAVEGTGNKFDVSGFSQEDRHSLDILLRRNLVKRCGEQDIVLSKHTLQSDTVQLHQPRQASCLGMELLCPYTGASFLMMVGAQELDPESQLEAGTRLWQSAVEAGDLPHPGIVDVNNEEAEARPM